MSEEKRKYLSEGGEELIGRLLESETDVAEPIHYHHQRFFDWEESTYEFNPEEEIEEAPFDSTDFSRRSLYDILRMNENEDSELRDTIEDMFPNLDKSYE
jgi:hypothetical protein